VTEKAISLLLEFDHHLYLLLSPSLCNHSARAYSDGLWELSWSVKAIMSMSRCLPRLEVGQLTFQVLYCVLWGTQRPPHFSQSNEYHLIHSFTLASLPQFRDCVLWVCWLQAVAARSKTLIWLSIWSQAGYPELWSWQLQKAKQCNSSDGISPWRLREIVYLF